MSEHHSNITWKRTTESFKYKDYNREHQWTFPNKVVIDASAAPQFLGREDHIDPEEAFVASLASCHMLTFLAVCAQAGISVDTYTDSATGYLEPNDNKKLVIGRVILKPKITFTPGNEPDEATLQKLHDKAHRECFLANSVTTSITVEE